LNGLTSGATIYNNGIFYRSPGSMGTHATYGLYATGVSGSGLNFNNNRIDQPGMVSGGTAQR
jgi:hypothetical protein